ncbi:MAG: hypothetical protein EBZ67_03485 [Chitinophagia bacterium]|nr:hypothetical protein [Chitinophagia bacterium]
MRRNTVEMSTLYGICRSEGPASRGDAGLRMLEVMDHWAADRRETSEEGGILLGHLLLETGAVRSEAGIERLDRLTIAADLRLDNRGELLHIVGIDPVRASSLSDAMIVLHLYRKSGIEGLSRLIGDFAIAIHDPEAHAMVCLRDPMGVRPFHYAILGNDLVFASEPRGVLAHPEVDASLDEDFILRLMAGLPPDPDATFHVSIRHLLPGHVLHWQPDKLSIRPLRVLCIPPLQRFRGPAECREAFREILRTTVACRLPETGPVGVELSGGLDSSAVAAFAMRSVSDAERIHSFTNVATGDVSAVQPAEDEWAYASAVVSHCGIRNSVRVSQGVWPDPFQPLDLHISDHSGVDIISPFWLEPARRLMREKGIRICLSGFFGDEVATHPSRLHYHDLLDDGRLLLYLRSCIERRDYMLPLRRLAGAILPAPLVRWSRKSTSPVSADYGYLLGTPPSTRVSQAEESLRPFSHRRLLLGLATRLHARRRMQNESIAAIRHRLVPRYPFADIRLVEFILSLPAEWTGRAGTDRYLYRSSLTGIVPEMVRLRTDKHVSTGLFPVLELKAVSQELRRQLSEIGASHRHPLALRLDFKRIDRDLEPGRPDNWWEGGFFPKVPFHILALARYFDERRR